MPHGTPLINRSDGTSGRTRVRHCENLRDITEPERHMLDFESGDPLMWKCEEDVHDVDEYFIFRGVVTHVHSDGTLDIYCDFCSDKPAGHEHSFCSRFLHGGVAPHLREILLRPAFRWFINSVIILAVLMSVLQYTFRETLIKNGVHRHTATLTHTDALLLPTPH